jgi:hypothetical protein
MAVLAVAAAVSAPSLARAGDSWYLLATTRDYSEGIFIDVTSIKASGTTRSAVVQTVERVSAEPGDIFATSVQIETDCTAHTLKMLKETTYNDLGATEDHPVSGGPATVLIPGSRGEVEAKFVCGPPESWDKTRLVDESSVGGSIREYGRFMLQGMLLDAFNGSSSVPK